MNALLLLGVVVSAYMQDVAFTTKTAFVAHGRLRLSMSADVVGMLTNTAYIVLTAVSGVTTGLSPQTSLAFALIAIGGALGTGSGVLLSLHLESRYGRPVPHRLRRGK